MFSFCSRKLLHIRLSGNSSTCIIHIRNPSGRFSSNATEQSSFTVDYLIHRCGLTQESAIKASQKINIKSTTKADLVLALLDSHGLPKPTISKLIRNFPTVLSADPKKILEPKLEFFSHMGISGPNLAKILYGNQSILASASLENQIIPSMEFLKSFLHVGKNIARAMSRMRWTTGFQRVMETNIEILRNQGVSESGISKLILQRPRLLTSKQSQFNEVVLQAKEMGCDPLHMMFIRAICTLSQMKKNTLELKLEVIRSFRWSEDEILCMFRKHPFCFNLSEKILRKRLDFFMNKLSFTAADITKNPAILTYSMEKRIIPRYSVLQVLLSKGLMKKQSISTAIKMTEDDFLEKFVRKYHHELPQLLKEYKQNME